MKSGVIRFSFSIFGWYQTNFKFHYQIGTSLLNHLHLFIIRYFKWSPISFDFLCFIFGWYRTDVQYQYRFGTALHSHSKGNSIWHSNVSILLQNIGRDQKESHLYRPSKEKTPAVRIQEDGLGPGARLQEQPAKRESASFKTALSHLLRPVKSLRFLWLRSGRLRVPDHGSGSHEGSVPSAAKSGFTPGNPLHLSCRDAPDVQDGHNANMQEVKMEIVTSHLLSLGCNNCVWHEVKS